MSMRIAFRHVKTKNMADTVQEVETGVETLHLNGAGSDSGNEHDTEIDKKWGLPEIEVYKIALKFYKGTKPCF